MLSLRAIRLAPVLALLLTLAPAFSQTGRPGFLSAPRKGDPREIALDCVRVQFVGKPDRSAAGHKFTTEDFRNPILRSRTTTRHNGVTHLTFRQEIRGLPVYAGDLSVNVTRNGRVINAHNRFAAAAATRAPAPKPQVKPEDAIRKAAEAVGLPASGDITLESGVPSAAARGQLVYSAPTLSSDPIPVNLMYFAKDDSIRLAWNLVLRTPDGWHWWDLLIDARSGELLSKADWISDSASYRVSPLPLESPDDGPQTLVSGIEDASASPFGWHDTNNAAGAEFTDTRGNNVDAHEDLDGTDVAGFRPDGGIDLLFDFPADFNLDPQAYPEAGVTSLFYLANVCHDIFYRYGFDEVSGNFQVNNYGHGGSASDAVQADSRDGLVANNAQFGTPPDGGTPRMEMGLVGSEGSLTISAPASIAGEIAVETGDFGAGTPPEGVTGTVVQAMDAVGVFTDGCSPFTNAAEISGNIALVDRGNCNFVVKVKEAQDAGAIGVIIVNNTGSNQLVHMLGTDPTLTIPAVFIGRTDGDAIKGDLAQGVQATLHVVTRRDTSLDATIVVHEYAHGLTTRLTGGPADSSCLQGLIPGGMGEGWSDFFGLALTAKASQTRETPRLIGAFAFGEGGIRTHPYSADRSVNPLTYANVSSLNEVHDIGEVWAQMLWEVYWDLIEHYGFDPNIATGSGGNNLAIQLVIDGLKLQPCDPTFLDARDAILSADTVNNSGANLFALWSGFARRGLGFSATAGTGVNNTSVTAAFDIPSTLDTEDSDGDGTSNLLEDAFDSDYLTPGTENLPTATTVIVGPSTYPAIRYHRRSGGAGTTGIDYKIAGLQYAVEQSVDLVTWTGGAGVVQSDSVAPDGNGVTETVVVRSLTDLATNPTQFLRVKVTRSAN